MNSKKKAAGFTLIELMITVAIIAILAGVALPSYQKYVIRGKRAAAQAQMMEIANRQQQYFLANRAYTNTASDLSYALPSEVSTNYDSTITPSKVLDASCASVDSTVPSFVIKFAAKGSQQSDGDLYLSSEGVKCPAGKW